MLFLRSIALLRVPYRESKIEPNKRSIRSDRGIWESSPAREMSFATIPSPKRIDQPAYIALHRLSVTVRTDHVPLAVKACGGQDKPTCGSGSTVPLTPHSLTSRVSSCATNNHLGSS